MNRFLLADDHSIVRVGIKNLIRDTYMNAVIDEVADGYELTEACKTNTYHLVVLDVNMPEMDFATVIPWIKSTHPPCRILVFTTYPAGTYGVRSIQAGADGFLNKSAGHQEILRAIQTLLSGKNYIPVELSEVMVTQWQQQSDKSQDNNPLLKLSMREMEIARLMKKGVSLPEIGKQLNLGYSTVVTYKKRIFRKLQVENVLALARTLQLHGLDE